MIPDRLILASGSPRRREILESLGWRFEIRSPDADETSLYGERPRDMALRLASEKALSVSIMPENSDALVIGADTVVDVDGTALGKPTDRADARRMLGLLSGRAHLVHTGVAVARGDALLASDVVTTSVTFGRLSDAEIDAFVASGLGDDKAGAYAIQGRGALLVEKIDGCYYNVVGLPAFCLNRMIKILENQQL